MKHSPRPKAAVASRTADSKSSGISSRGAGHLDAAAAAAEGGLDGHRQAELVHEVEDFLGGLATGSAVPGTCGAPTFSAMWRAWTLSPSGEMASGEGPIQVMPASMTWRANSAFSARKP